MEGGLAGWKRRRGIGIWGNGQVHPRLDKAPVEDVLPEGGDQEECGCVPEVGRQRDAEHEGEVWVEPHPWGSGGPSVINRRSNEWGEKLGLH